MRFRRFNSCHLCFREFFPLVSSSFFLRYFLFFLTTTEPPHPYPSSPLFFIPPITQSLILTSHRPRNLGTISFKLLLVKTYSRLSPKLNHYFVPSPAHIQYLQSQLSNILPALGLTFTTCACRESAKGRAIQEMEAFVEGESPLGEGKTRTDGQISVGAGKTTHKPPPRIFASVLTMPTRT